jgi:tetratricopeptide (TPR) repeat protein
MLLPPQVLERLLDGALAANRAGTLDKFCRQRARAARWCLRHFTPPLAWFELAAATDQAADSAELGWLAEQALCWILFQLRPDGAPLRAPIPHHAWMGATPWRPLLAVACHHALLAVPDYPQRYRSRPGEPAFEHLCGLWDIAPSSFYRYVERGRQLLAMELASPLTSERAMSLAAFACESSYQRLGLADAQARREWHQHSARVLQDQGRAGSTVGALWHTVRAGELAPVLAQLELHSLDLAASEHTDAVLATLNVGDAELTPRLQLALARANLAQVRGNLQDEQAQLALALRHAVSLGDPGWLGAVYAARGRFHEARNQDRALADYREAVACFEQAAPPGTVADARITTGLLGSLVSMAELSLLRNDPRAVAILERADQLAAEGDMPVDLQAKLLLARGEYWQRQGDLDKAIEVTHHALQVSERAGHQRRVVSAWGRLAMQYGDAKDIDHALHYARLVESVSKVTPLAPETVAAISLNLGIAFFWKDRLEEAIDSYKRAAQLAQSAGLHTILGRAQYNLAEAYFTRFQRSGSAEDELQGDAYSRLAQALWEADNDAGLAEATRNLKRTVLGEREHLVYDRLLPAELAAHFDEMKLIEQQRHRLESSSAVDDRVQAHLGISQSYLRIAVAERETALSLASRHGLQTNVSQQLQALRDTFEQALSNEEQWASRWEQAQVVPREHVAALVRRLFAERQLTKSSCALACAVSPATASKYLADLAAAGLLSRVGKGPATHYVLP